MFFFDVLSYILFDIDDIVICCFIMIVRNYYEVYFNMCVDMFD